MNWSAQRSCRRLLMAALAFSVGGSIASANCPTPLRPMNVVKVVNAATFQPGISGNSLFTILGSEFASPGVSRPVHPPDLVDGKFPTEFACIAVEFDGERVPIVFVSPVQINAQAPTRLLSGPVRVTVIRNPGQIDEIRFSVDGVQTQLYAPTFFTFDGHSIAAQHLNYDILAEPSVLPLARPAAPGEIVILYGTGFGYTEPVWQSGELPDQISWLRDAVTITIGGVVLPPDDVFYAGLTYGSISGLYQFNVRVPLGTPDGHVPVVIWIGGFRTQLTATIPVNSSN